AVIEARQSGIPMILATADRPPYLRATGANQAIDQLKLFGDYPVFFHEVGEPKLDEKDLNRLKMLARQAIDLTRRKRGPAHLNFPFRKPLEPGQQFVRQIENENEGQNPSDITLELQDNYQLPTPIKDAISSAQRPLIIVGPTAPKDHTESIAALAKQINSPVLSESSLLSNNTIGGFAGFLRTKSIRKKLGPDLILRFGFQPTAKSLEQAQKDWQPLHHFHFASTHDWQDATFSGSTPLPWLGRPLSSNNLHVTADNSWINSWKDIEKKFQFHLEKQYSDCEALTDGHIYRHIVPQCSRDDFIMVSNSFPARDIQLFSPETTKYPLFLNRGASGIDGITSTAMGISLGMRQPGILFTGDLAFLHDTNALLNYQKIGQSLTVIIINNAGGSIFRMLPIEQHEEYFKEYFETPQTADIEGLVKSYGIPYQKITSKEAIREFDLQEWQRQQPGFTVIECQTDADASMRLREKAWNF